MTHFLPTDIEVEGKSLSGGKDTGRDGNAPDIALASNEARGLNRPVIEIRRLSKKFLARQNEVLAVDNVDLVVQPAQIVSIVGPSGCGKSTVLNIVAGFESASSGEVLVAGAPVKRPGPDRGMVFQTASLFPWYTVLQNIVYGPKRRGEPQKDYLREAANLIEAAGLGGFERHYPYQLSGGMAQRVAIARAFINRPRVLLLDEPFGALDAQTRLVMQRLLLAMWRDYQMTVIFVTHDVEEAVFLSDRVVVMSARPGRIIADIGVDLDRARELDVVTTPHFIDLRRRILELILSPEDFHHHG
jgi:NitT/TauT family transport system ATP-binding protein